MDKNIQHNDQQQDFSQLDTKGKILLRSGEYKLTGGISKEEAFARLSEKISLAGQEENQKVFRLPGRTFFYYAAAIALLLIATAVFLRTFTNSNEKIIASRGIHSEFKLPDGSLINLNAETNISYNKLNYSKSRKLKMEGEAFFNVEKGNPFTIETKQASIQVLGTSFNVYSRGDKFSVSCFTGKILVSSGNKSVTILPMETVRLINNELVVEHNPEISTVADWRYGEFNFENTALIIVFEEIERQFNVTFELPDIGDKYFTGSISNKNLVNALDIVCLPMELTYEIGSNSRILIKPKNH